MITGPTLALRPFDRRHAERTRTWVNDPELARLLGRAHPVSDVEHERWLTELEGRTDRVFFALETLDALHVGNVWLWNIDSRHRRAEVRIVIGDGGGHGMGTEALDLIARYALERLNLHKLYAYVLAINPRALRAFEKSGFEVEGVLKQDRWDGHAYVDVYLVGRILG